MDWLSNYLAQSLIVIGLILLVVEVLVLGFSTFVLFFVGLAAVITGLLLSIGVIPDSLMSALTSTGVLTALLATFLWRPLKAMQNKVETKKAASDLVGHSFVLSAPVSMSENPVYRYSGIDWRLSSESELPAGTEVEVIDVAVGKFVVKAKTE